MEKLIASSIIGFIMFFATGVFWLNGRDVNKLEPREANAMMVACGIAGGFGVAIPFIF